MKDKNILLLSIKDFLTPKMLKYALLPFIVTLILMYVIFFVIAGMGVDSLATLDVQSTQTTMQNGIPHTESITAKLEGLAIIQYLMSFAVTSWIATFLIYTIGGFLTLHASIFIAIIVIGFLTPVVMKELQRRHYYDVEMIGHSNILSGIFSIIKWTLVMLLFFILLIPFYFIIMTIPFTMSPTNWTHTYWSISNFFTIVFFSKKCFNVFKNCVHDI